MTRSQRKKLAKAARELASDFAEGRGPALRNYTFETCAVGCVISRALGPQESYGLLGITIDNAVGAALTSATAYETGDCFSGVPMPGAVVFPLLWLADELESAP